jgi:diguanylate cyclase (GGDEF)-like protein
MQRAKGSVLVRWIGLAMALPALAAVVLLTKDAVLVIKNVNADALKREEAALERGLKMLGDVNASELISQTLWDEAFRNVVLSKRPDWIQEHFGPNALSDKAAQKFVILEPDGKITFASDSEGAPSPQSAAEILAAAAPPIARARMLYREARASNEGFDERMPGAMTDGVYVSDVVRIGDKPAMVTVSPFAPDDESIDTPQEPTLLLGIQFMTDTLLDKLESLSHIEGLEHVKADHEKTTGEHAHAIRDANGNTVAHVTWDFRPPGEAVLKAALPTIALSLGLVVLLTVAAAVTMRRLTRKLADSEQAAVYASRHDVATGLANRGWFMNQFDALLAPSHQLGDRLRAVLLIDCDYFKSINDTLGHAAGDAVLAALASRMKSLDQRIETAARLGGDEFALISAPLETADAASVLLRAVETVLMQPVLFGPRVIPVSVSIGAALFEDGSEQHIDTLLAQADMALYRAKRDGRGCSRTFDASMDNAGATPDFPVRDPASDRADAANVPNATNRAA